MIPIKCFKMNNIRMVRGEINRENVLCHLTGKIMTIPIILPDGFYYDFNSIVRWLKFLRFCPSDKKIKIKIPIRPIKVPKLKMICEKIKEQNVIDDNDIPSQLNHFEFHSREIEFYLFYNCLNGVLQFERFPFDIFTNSKYYIDNVNDKIILHIINNLTNTSIRKYRDIGIIPIIVIASNYSYRILQAFIQKYKPDLAVTTQRDYHIIHVLCRFNKYETIVSYLENQNFIGINKSVRDSEDSDILLSIIQLLDSNTKLSTDDKKKLKKKIIKINKKINKKIRKQIKKNTKKKKCGIF
jgi:hypothetical protein